MDDEDRAKARTTAAALLKDEDFIIKYPALARALKESVDSADSSLEPGNSHCAGSRPSELQEVVSLQKATPVPTPPVAGTRAPSARGQEMNADEQRFQAPSTVVKSPDDSIAEPKQHDPSKHGSQEPTVELSGSTKPEATKKENAGTNMGPEAEGDGQYDQKPLDPPLHYMKRLEQLQRGYVQIMQQRNSVELQYHLLKKTGRPLLGARPGALALSSSPPFMLPSTSARPLTPYQTDEWKQGTREQQEQQHAIMQLQRTATPVLSSFGRGPPWQSQWTKPTGMPPVALAEWEKGSGDRASSLDWLRQHLHHEKPRPTVDPAVLYEKTGMDLAVNHLKDQAERMHTQSREITRAIMQKQKQAEIEALQAKQAHPLLAELTSEQQRLIEEQLRCIDEARGDLATAQAEAERIELRSRDALYHAAYSENADPELVRLHAERMKEITKIQEENPLPNQSLTTRAVAEGLSDPLEAMAQRNVDFREQRLSAAAAQLAVSRMLHNLGYLQDSEEGTFVRRGDGPALYKSKFPGVYPDLGYCSALPVSQMGRSELYHKFQQDGKLRTFADFVEEAQERHEDSAAVRRGEEQQRVKLQQEKREEDDDWARLCLSKLHSKNIALEEAREARRQAAEAQKSLEAMRQRQEQVLAERNELAELERKHRAPARAAEEAERQAAAKREARAAAERAIRAPSRSATLTVEAAAEGVPRRGASVLGRSRTVSLSRASFSQADIKDEGHNREHPGHTILGGSTDNVGKTIQDSFEMAPPKRLSTAIPQQGRRKGEILNNALSERLPPYRCEEFVFLSPPVEATPAKLKFLYGQLKRVFSAGELGSSEHVQLVYDFAVGCCQEFVREDPSSQEYANALIQSLPYYPYQIDIQRAGIIGLLNIFECDQATVESAPSNFVFLSCHYCCTWVPSGPVRSFKG